MLAELGHAEAIAGRAEAIDHLEAAIALVGDASARLGCCSDSVVPCTTVGACLTRRGVPAGSEELDAVGADETGLRVDLDGGYLNAALFVPDRSLDARRRARAVMASAERLASDASWRC